MPALAFTPCLEGGRADAKAFVPTGGKEPNRKTDLGEITRFLDSVHMSKILPCRTRSPTTPAAGPNSPVQVGRSQGGSQLPSAPSQLTSDPCPRALLSRGQP